MASARLVGRRRVLLRLETLKPEVAKEISAAMAANASDMLEAVLPRVPEDQGDLRRATGKEQIGVAPAIRWRVFSGDAKAFYARFVEFNQGAYFYPTYRALRRRMKARLGRAFGKAKRRIFR